MKKALLSLICLLSMNNSSSMDMQQMVRQVEVQVDQSVTPQALQVIDKIVRLLSDELLRSQLITMVKNHGKESLTFFAESLRSVMSTSERVQLVDLLDEIYDWYTQLLAMAMDVKALQTPAGQEAYMQHQMKPFLMIQKPLFAAMVKRVIEFSAYVERNPKALDDFRAGFGSLLKEQYDNFKIELSK